MGLGCLSEPKFTLRLLIVTMGLDKSSSQSPQGGLKKDDVKIRESSVLEGTKRKGALLFYKGHFIVF